MESLAHELRQSAALFLAGAKRCEIERAESDQAPSGHQACARLLLSLVTRSRAMTSLWMNPTVDAAGRGNSEPPDGGGDTRPRGGASS